MPNKKTKGVRPPLSTEFIRNFVIMAHIDHGKSTLADRLFEFTAGSNVPQPQFLDQMELEREKGITIKLAPLRMSYQMTGVTPPSSYVLNLIDTPGHVDFKDEVIRSLKAVEGAILLVDACKGIQAQTVSNWELAQELGLKIIPVINKIDLASAQIEKTKQELSKLCSCPTAEILEISAKTGQNIEQVLKAVVSEIPSPKSDPKAKLETFVFDAVYDNYSGVIAYLKVKQGTLKNTVKNEIGIFSPERTPVIQLSAGEIGYFVTGVKDLKKYRQSIGYKPSMPMVFANVFGEFEPLSKAINQLKLNDASLDFQAVSSRVLGRGFCCGFLGMLHLEIILERLKREHGLTDLILTPPFVNYQTKPDGLYEPWTMLNIITPPEYLGPIWELLKDIEGTHQATDQFSENKLIIKYETPLREIIQDFYDQLKSASSGYGSIAYQVIDYRPADLVELDILVAGQKQEMLSQLVAQKKAYKIGKEIVSRLKKLIPAQQFQVPLQAAVDGKILARETIKARRKDVTGALYGGDVTRKRKLLERQKKGKKKLAQRGQVKIPAEVFIKLFQNKKV